MASEPKILAFDTSAAHCAAALLCGDSVVASRRVAMARGQADALMPLLEQVLADAHVTWDWLDTIGVGVGPGNFTGIRIAVSAARGLTMGLGISAHGVSTLEALAFGRSGPAVAALPAPRGQVYAQVFGGGDPAQPQHLDERQLRELAGGLAIISGDCDRLTGMAPAYPLAEAIARIAANRPADAATPPAPLYLKTADAAPSRDVPPVILP